MRAPGPGNRSLTRLLIVVSTAAFLGGGGAAHLLWFWTGDDRWAIVYVRTAGSALLVVLPGAAAYLSYRISREFSGDEPMRAAWRLIAASALFDLCGQFASQVLAAPFAAPPLALAAWWPPGVADRISEAGFFLSGPCRFALLAFALYCALEVYRRAGFLGKFRGLNWPTAAAMGVYVVVEAFATGAALWRGKSPSLGEVSHYPTDPLLFVLLVEAMLLYRSAQEMGGGLVGDCWKCMGLSVFLTSMGDMLLMATNYRYLPWPWSSVSWYVWVPAAAAFALAPTYQLDAMARARSSRREP